MVDNPSPHRGPARALIHDSRSLMGYGRDAFLASSALVDLAFSDRISSQLQVTLSTPGVGAVSDAR